MLSENQKHDLKAIQRFLSSKGKLNFNGMIYNKCLPVQHVIAYALPSGCVDAQTRIFAKDI